MDKKELVDKLDAYGVPKNEGLKLWKIGEEYKSNILVDGTKGIQYLNEIKDNCIAGMTWMLGKNPFFTMIV